ncbi:MAG: PAS domain S-box protein, partial [Bacteroidota bacterium]
VNNAAVMMTGYSKEELLQMKFWSILHPDEKKILKARGFKRLSGKKVPSTYELRLITKSGDIRFIEYSAGITRYKGNVAAIGVAIDITEKKIIQEKINFKNSQRIRFQSSMLDLLKIEEHDITKVFKIITKSVANCLAVERVGIWLFSSDNKFLYCPTLFQRSKKSYSPQEKIEVSHYPKYFKALSESLNITADNVYENKYTQEFSETYLKPLNIYSMLDIPVRSKGIVIGVICCEHIASRRQWTEEEQDFVISVAEIISINMEGSERFKTEESLSTAHKELNKAFRKLKEREEIIKIEKEKLEVTLRSIGDGVITTDSKGKIILLNKTAEKLTGWTQSEAYGRPFDKVFVVIDECTKIECHSSADIVLRTGEVAEPTNHTSLVSKNGYIRIITDSAYPIRDRNGNIFGVILVFRDTTENKIAEQNLKESEEGYRTLFETANDAIFILQDEIFIACNQKSLDMFQCSAENIIGKSPVDFSPEKQPGNIFSKILATEKIKNALAGTPQSFDWVHQHTDGSPFNAEVSLIKIEVQGKPYLQAIVRDITESKKAELAIIQSEKQFRTIFENAPIGKCLVGTDGIFITINNSLCEILGFTKEELVNTHFIKYTHPDDIEKSNIWVQQMLAGENVTPHIEKRYIHKDGHTIWALVSASLFRDSSGSPKYFITQILDITQRKTAEENIKKFKFIVDNTGEEFYLVHPYGNLEYINRAAAQSLGYSVEELLQIGIPGFDLTYTTPEEYYKHFLQLKEKDIPAFETPHRTKDGRLLTKLVKAVYLIIDDKEYVCSFANDISELKKASEVIKQNEEKFRLLFTSTSQAVTLNEIILDKNGEPCDYRILEANPAFEVHTGLKCKDCIGKKVLEVLPDTEMFWIKEFGEVALSGSPKRIENYSKELEKYFDFTVYSPRKGQFALISTDITDRKHEEESKRLNADRLEALILLNNMTYKSLEELTDYALEEAVKLTGSKFGYLAFMNDDESIIHLHSWSSEVMNMCKVKDSYHQFIVKDTGLLGEPIRARKPIITNRYTADNPLTHGFPEGHVPIIRHVSVPIFDGNKIVILAGAANKEVNYNDTDVNQLTLLMDGMWRLIQRRKADEALKESEERYRLITNNSNDIIVKFGTNGKISFVSPVCKT